MEHSEWDGLAQVLPAPARKADGSGTIAAVRPRRRRVPASPAVTTARRTLLGYLLMPRPKDLFKAALMPAVLGWGVLAAGGVDARTVLRAAVVLAVLELLVYPARYQWNDVRGFVADQRHPAEADRGRLPGPMGSARAHIRASCVVALLRLAATAALPFLVPGLHLGGPLLAITVGVFGVAIAYEWLRGHATGRSGAVPAPLTPGIVLLWLTVGAGYVVRGLAGLTLVLNPREHPALTVAAGVTLWAYGVAFVTSRWAIEATAFARLDDDRVVWSAEARHAREHLLGLVRWLPRRVRADDAVSSSASWPPLRRGTSLWAPWNLAVIVAGAAAALTGRLAAGPATTTDALTVAVAGAVVAVAVAVVAFVARPGLPVRGAATVAGAAVLVIVLLLQRQVAEPVIAVVPWTAVLIAYVYFTGRCRQTMGAIGRWLRRPVEVAGAPVARLVLGRETWNLLAVRDGRHEQA